MKHRFPKKTEKLICEGCGDDLKNYYTYDDSGDLDYPFCNKCIAFVDGKIVKKD